MPRECPMRGHWHPFLARPSTAFLRIESAALCAFLPGVCGGRARAVVYCTCVYAQVCVHMYHPFRVGSNKSYYRLFLPTLVPGVVSGFTVPSSDFTSLVLNWDPPLVDEEFYLSFNYSLQWYSATSESEPPADLPSSDPVGSLLVVRQLETEIEFLQPNVSYWFYITAISSEGMGEERVGAIGTTLNIG